MPTEFTTVSSSSFDPAALASKLTDKSAEGWTVVSIVSTGGDVTAFLSRESHGQSTNGSVGAGSSTGSAGGSTSSTSSTGFGGGSGASTGSAVATQEPVPTYEPAAASEPEPASSPEPAGWASAPEPTPEPAPEPVSTYSPAPEPTPSYSPTPPTPTPAPTPSVPAGWYADPAGRFELRYWDGSTWTEHVSRAGQQYTDPPVA